jgi:hypothetical protein
MAPTDEMSSVATNCNAFDCALHAILKEGGGIFQEPQLAIIQREPKENGLDSPLDYVTYRSMTTTELEQRLNTLSSIPVSMMTEDPKQQESNGRKRKQPDKDPKEELEKTIYPPPPPSQHNQKESLLLSINEEDIDRTAYDNFNEGLDDEDNYDDYDTSTI